MENFSRKREKAYYFIAEQAKKLRAAPKYKYDKTIDNADFISLDELYRIKKGLADPSPELVSKMKKLLQHVTSESEIDEYLVKPFFSKK